MTTVIIPNYNGRHYLSDCLKSLYQDIKELDSEQTVKVIVVDDGSNDGSVDFITTVYPEVEIIALKANTGFCHAINRGIEAAKTEFVLLLNNDTIIKPGFILALQKAITHSPKIFSVAAKMLDIGHPGLVESAGDLYTALGWAVGRGRGKKSKKYKRTTPVFSACAGAAIYRREMIVALGYFDETHFAYLEDVDLGYAARLRGYKNRCCSAAEVFHIGSATTGSRYNFQKTRLSSQNSIILIAKNMPLLQILVNLPFLLLGFFVKTLFYFWRGMGICYLQGLGRGIKMSFSKEVRSRKVRFRIKNTHRYLLIQLELFINILRGITMM
ncbi:MAG: glycosyltransferase family 2 protein [Lachnospiraceae bacterium]|jgi:GT2 family glycosyltransferase|nr:glycosyltransferase family 2 protein [Lachnospiraceae bacterium]